MISDPKPRVTGTTHTLPFDKLSADAFERLTLWLAVGVQGMGGIGKSVLAAALAQEAVVKAAFPDGIFWVAVGQRPDLRRLQIELAMAAGEARPIIESVHQGKLLLSRLLAERTVLVVLDDLWNLDDAAAFNVLGPRGRLLITTRHADLLVGLGA